MASVREGWVAYSADAPACWFVGRTYPDGTDIQMKVIALPTGRFEVILSAEHRCSGPSDARVGEFASLDEAISAANSACTESDRDHLS